MMLDFLERQTGPDPQWTVLWLHGLGADGHDFAPIVPELVRPSWPALRFVFPHAPVRPITINHGMRMRGWYDITGVDITQRADAAGIAESVALVEELMTREQQRGVPARRLLLAGFSQGGAITLSAGLRRLVPLAGLIALSTYLPEIDKAESLHQVTAQTQPVFMAHGITDPVIPLAAAMRSAQTLSTLGFAIDWHTYPMAHQVCAEEISALGDWLEQRLATV